MKIKKSTTGAAIAAVLAIGLFSGTVDWRFSSASASRIEDQKAFNAVDVGFVQSMLVHNCQAIQMSLMMQESDFPEVRRIAKNILLAQMRESGMYQGWLAMLGEKTLPPGKPMQWVEAVQRPTTLADRLYQDRCRSVEGQMPGVPHPAQITELSTLNGPAKDQLFLKLMVAHHEAALPMAEFARNNGSSTLVKGAAWSVISDQRLEIAHMQKMTARIEMTLNEQDSH